MDNALPHLFSEEDLAQAAAQSGKAANRRDVRGQHGDYDRLIEERPVVQGPGFISDAGGRRIVFQLWTDG
jgi:hypothetical protein